MEEGATDANCNNKLRLIPNYIINIWKIFLLLIPFYFFILNRLYLSPPNVVQTRDLEGWNQRKSCFCGVYTRCELYIRIKSC